VNRGDASRLVNQGTAKATSDKAEKDDGVSGMKEIVDQGIVLE